MTIACLVLVQASVAWPGQGGTYREVDGEETLTWPLWEVGLFLGAARLPHYRGSDEHSVYVLPLPYVIYRGDVLKVDQEGILGIVWERDRMESGLSFGGNPPVDGENKAREGMPKLAAIVEVGPTLKYFFTDRNSPSPLYVGIALRGTLSVDVSDMGMGYEGVRGGFELVYRNRTAFKEHGFSFGGSAAVEVADRRYNRFFYEVKPQHATDDRPAYRAELGYGGFSLTANIFKEITDRWGIGAFYRWDNMTGAAFRDSPLFRTENNHLVGCALIWTVQESRRVVTRPHGF